MNRSTLTILAASALLVAASFAQDPGFMENLDPQKHRELMPRHMQMLKEQKKQDAELKPLLDAMNSAKGEDRVDALVAVVNKLVEQRNAMHEKMARYLDRQSRRAGTLMSPSRLFV